MSTCKVTIMTEKLEELDAAARRALEKTAEVIHTQVEQAQVMPFRTGHLQNDSTFVDTSAAAQGHVDLVSCPPALLSPGVHLLPGGEPECRRCMVRTMGRRR